MNLYEAIKKRSNNLEKMFNALITIKPKSVEPERASSATGLFVTKLRNRLNDWKCALIVMSQYYKHQWQTVLYLINNSLINCAGTNSNDFTTILSFYCSESHSFQNRKTVFLGLLFSATRNPGFKILPRIGNTNFLHSKLVYQSKSIKPTETQSRRTFPDISFAWWHGMILFGEERTTGP